MSTPEYDKWINFLLAITIMLAVTSGFVYADSSQAITALTKSYELGSDISTEEAQKIVLDLNKALEESGDEYLSYRIKYRIGIIYFKANALNESMDQFVKIIDDSQSPEDIRALSLNMVGQISRMQGKNADALKAFQRTINIFENRLKNDRGLARDMSSIKVYVSSIISSAEIYELQHNYLEGISQYNYLQKILKENNLEDFQNQYSALVNDKISQLYLRDGETEKYMSYAEKVLADSTEYARKPVVKLEMACVEYLSAQNKDIEFPNGSFEAPSLLIAHIKNTEVKSQFEKMIELIDTMSDNYKNQNGGDLLLYHYAWLLDTMGNKDKAFKIFSQIIPKSKVNETDKTGGLKIASTIQEYAKIQYAIMAGEKMEYNDALKVLDTLGEYPENTHLSELSKSVIESIKTLKREVPVNEQ